MLMLSNGKTMALTNGRVFECEALFLDKRGEEGVSVRREW
jgi:hypothetical protein